MTRLASWPQCPVMNVCMAAHARRRLLERHERAGADAGPRHSRFVTRLARRGEMSAGEERLQGAGVDVGVFGDLERIGRMTPLALQRNLAAMRIMVAGGTCCTDPLEDTRFATTGREIGGRRLMTRDAHDGGVLAHQRERRALVCEGGYREVSRLHRVTRFAGGTELAEVNVTVAGRTSFGGIYKPDTDRTGAGGRRYRSQRARMALRACQRRVLPLEERSRLGVHEGHHLERSRVMAAHARRPQLASVDVHVTRGAFGAEPPKIRVAPGRDDPRPDVDALVTIDARKHGVLVSQRESRRVVIELPFLKT